MDIYILNSKFEIIEVVDCFESIIWNNKFYSVGDFELYVGMCNTLTHLLEEDIYFVRDKDVDGDSYKNVMIPLDYQINTNVETGDYLTITGKSIKSIVGQRIIANQTNLTGTVEDAIRKVINENIIMPTNSLRKIDNFTLATKKGFTETIDAQVTGDNIAEWLETICKTYEYGWDVYIKDNKFVFELLKGVDRSYNQTTNPYVTFSQNFDNLISTNYQKVKSNYKNVALVAGEGEGLERRTYFEGSTRGLARKEMYVDARDISSNDGEIGTTEYMNLLKERGQENLAENKITETFDGEIEPATNYQLGVDYTLGDYVEVINEYGLAASAQIIETIESVDTNGESVIPTFSAFNLQD